jgi:hypothetical protein
MTRVFKESEAEASNRSQATMTAQCMPDQDKQDLEIQCKLGSRQATISCLGENKGIVFHCVPVSARR